MHHCHAVCRRLKLCVAVLALCPWSLELVQHISVLGGSSKCSKSSIVQFQCTAVQQRLDENRPVLSPCMYAFTRPRRHKHNVLLYKRSRAAQRNPLHLDALVWKCMLNCSPVHQLLVLVYIKHWAYS